jgi:hypothetical protein
LRYRGYVFAEVQHTIASLLGADNEEVLLIDESNAGKRSTIKKLKLTSSHDTDVVILDAPAPQLQLSTSVFDDVSQMRSEPSTPLRAPHAASTATSSLQPRPQHPTAKAQSAVPTAAEQESMFGGDDL